MAGKGKGKGAVCVTGTGGYVASWVVKLLLSNNYTVHGTVRDPLDDKYNHLKKLEKTPDSLKLFKADLLDYNSILAAIRGCDGVFHVASPVPSSSVPNPENWYSAAKTIAEKEALEYTKVSGLNIVTVCPSIVIRPMLQSTLNASNLFLLHYMKDASDTVEDKDPPLVDVRDLAEGILLTYEKPEAEGRYICSSFFFPPEFWLKSFRAFFQITSTLQVPLKYRS